jgi:dimethylaniline monooxygenase (N-oxide forming)
MTRLAATFTPSFMSGDLWWTRLLHFTEYRVRIMSPFWSAVDAETRKEANFVGRESLQGFEELKAHSP